MERTDYGKIAFTLFAPGVGAVRVATQTGFQDTLGSYEFFAYRKRGIEPSQIPWEVTGQAVEYVLTTAEDQAFLLSRPEDISFSRPKNSFAKVRCEDCGEYVFEPYIRIRDGRHLCIPCSHYRDEAARGTV